MKRTIKLWSLVTVIALALAACGGGAKDKNAQAKELNTKIEKLNNKSIVGYSQFRQIYSNC